MLPFVLFFDVRKRKKLCSNARRRQQNRKTYRSIPYSVQKDKEIFTMTFLHHKTILQEGISRSRMFITRSDKGVEIELCFYRHSSRSKSILSARDSFLRNSGINRRARAVQRVEISFMSSWS